MPTYEYRCKDCGEHLEVVQSFNDQALTVCPACGGGLHKVFGNIGITFKGSGFYRTDNRAGSRRAETASTSESKSSESKSSESKSSESKSSESKSSESKSSESSSSSSSSPSSPAAASA
jgi:putative FmdB family regulatory protein